ncbi:hypothetical protein Barb6XT_01824 [Bacteroidales bacterium Barb6XT]|nr:hypothetical protein Barb6XT_01824 [Bacteroidales bacterium Barb6XT]
MGQTYEDSLAGVVLMAPHTAVLHVGLKCFAHLRHLHNISYLFSRFSLPVHFFTDFRIIKIKVSP